MQDVEVFSDGSGLKLIDIETTSWSTSHTKRRGIGSKKVYTDNFSHTIDNSTNLYKSEYGAVESLSDYLSPFKETKNYNNEAISSQKKVTPPINIFSLGLLIAFLIFIFKA